MHRRNSGWRDRCGFHLRSASFSLRLDPQYERQHSTYNDEGAVNNTKQTP
jgi:hypothetical protein